MNDRKCLFRQPFLVGHLCCVQYFCHSWYRIKVSFLAAIAHDSWTFPRINSLKWKCWGKLFFFLKFLVHNNIYFWASLVAQWLGIRLPMQGTRVRAPVWEDPTCRGATEPVSHNYWACAFGAHALQQERPRHWEARAPRWRVAPARRN